MIWSKKRIESWREATTVNNKKNVNITTPSTLVHNFCAFSKAVSRIVLVTYLESMAKNAFELWMAHFLVRATNTSTVLADKIDWYLVRMS